MKSLFHDPDNNILVKFADDMTVSAPMKNNYNFAPVEVDNTDPLH